jgi:SHS2 domain-containing protein
VSMKKRFESLEHTADIYIAAYGQSLEEAFENAASATFNAMTEIEKINPEVEEFVEIEAHDEHALLYSWIEELLIRFETTEKLYCCFNISSIEKTPTGLKLKAKIWGEPFDSQRHLQKVGIKAVTYHRMEIMKKPKAVTVKFILDI